MLPAGSPATAGWQPALPRFLHVAELPASATYTRSIFTFTLMAKYRLLLACAAAFISTFALGAEPATRQAATLGEKTPAPPKEPAITFSSVHVDGPYIAMTFDDGPSAVLTPKLLDSSLRAISKPRSS